jgi:hypothetical protein
VAYAENLVPEIGRQGGHHFEVLAEPFPEVQQLENEHGGLSYSSRQ